MMNQIRKHGIKYSPGSQGCTGGAGRAGSGSGGGGGGGTVAAGRRHGGVRAVKRPEGVVHISESICENGSAELWKG